jgi:hypothetical protein
MVIPAGRHVVIRTPSTGGGGVSRLLSRAGRDEGLARQVVVDLAGDVALEDADDLQLGAALL